MKSVQLYFVRLFCFSLLAVGSLPLLVFAQQQTIEIVFDGKNETFSFTAAEMKQNLEKAGYMVSLAGIGSLKNVAVKNRFIITTRDRSEAKFFLNPQSVDPLRLSGSQSYSIRKKENAGYTDWYIIGFDNRGAIYGGLDISEAVRLKGYESLIQLDKEPYISNRGIKFNIPLDARTPSYSDNADAAQQNIQNMWDVNFWHEFLDEMARDRFNMLSLWSLSPFPSLVDVPEYPRAGLNDVMKTTVKLLPTTDATFMSTPASLASLVTVKKISLAEKIKFWQHIMDYARVRGIDCYLFTWNLFTYGTENSGYGFTDQITDSKTKDYIRKATKALISTYPLLKGIGLTAGENMMKQSENAKEKFLYESYGEGINDALAIDPKRTFQLIHRAHQADIDMIKKIFTGLNSKCRLDFSYKYSVAQMYAAVAPKYIYESRFLEKIKDSKFFLTVRDDSWYNLRGGSDPAFAREYFKNMPKNNFEGFYVGPDGYTWGKEYLSRNAADPRELVIKKRWYSFKILGKLSYDPTTTDDYFVDLIHDRFPEANPGKLAAAWASASQVMPLVNRFHNGRSQNDFQWYPEGCTSFYGFRTINSFIKCAPQKGEDLIGIPEYSNVVLKGEQLTGTTPVALAEQLNKISDHALMLIGDMKDIKNRDLQNTIDDIKAMSLLGQYYSKKILAAVNKDLYVKSTGIDAKTLYKKNALENLKDAAGYWKRYADQVTSAYIPQYLTRMHYTVDFKAMQAHVDKEVTAMTMIDELMYEPPVAGIKPLTEDVEIVFSKSSKYYYWHLDKLGLPENWSSFKSVVLEVFATSNQPFDLFLKAGADTIIKRNIVPSMNKITRVLIPFNTFTKMDISIPANKTAVAAYAMHEVSDIGVSMDNPDGYTVLEIRSVTLSNEEK